MLLLDTTVLVYAVGSDHELREPCQRLVRAVADQKLRATTTVEVIQEFAHVRARRRSRSDAAQVAADYVDLLSPLLTVTAAHIRSGLALFERSSRLGCFDAVLAAAALDGSMAALVSADRALAEVGGLVTVYPDAVELAALLA